MTAIEAVATNSAWARWYAAQLLTINERRLLPKSVMYRTVAWQIINALRDGKLKAKGRLPNSTLYQEIPTEAWWLFDMRVTPYLVIAEPKNCRAPGVTQVLSYDSITVDPRDLERLWPKNCRHFDRSRKRLLEKAIRERICPEIVEMLQKGNLIVWPETDPTNRDRAAAVIHRA